MKSPRPSTNSSSSPSFALISVLALVSLAALTATAFLASARLERQATMPLTQTTMLDMALDSGAVAALRLLEYGGGEQFNHVVTYWRGTNANDWTNELGYLLIGSLRSNDISSNPLKVKYYFCFSSAALTNLATNLSKYTNHESAGNQAQFNRQINNELRTLQRGTNFAAGQSTNIPLLGDTPTNRFTSPPVGWVYINQDVRIKPGQTNTTNVPVARFAFYVQDLSSMIDADRMGGETDRSTGTNPAEISLTNLTGTALTNATTAANFTSTNNRTKYLSPGMLVLSSGGRLNTNDLRYVTTGLRHWTNAYERIPFGLGYSNCGTSDRGTNKYNLATGSSVADIAATINTNLPGFTNRAGGMSGNTYVSNIAANIVDLFDSDNFATTVGNSVRGIDSYPFVNEIWDRFELKNINVNTNAPTNWVVTYDLEITTWMELWNISSQPITSGSMSIFYRNRETLTNRLGTTTNNDIPVSFTNTLNYTTNLSWNFTTNFLPTNPSVSDLTNSRISPNSFHMLSFPPFTINASHSLIIPAGTDPKKTNLVLLWATNGNLNGYATYFSSNSASLPSSMSTHPSRVDSSSSAFNGIQRNTNKANTHFLDSSQTVWWRGNATPNSDLTLALTGDPRIMFHLSPTAGQTWWDHQFESGRASWWARNTLSGLDYTVDLSKWPETSHNTTAYANITDPSTNPVKTGITRAQETNKPIQIIYNTLPTNIVQLGQVFDPMQWSYNVNNNTNGLPLTGATAANSSGGGHTLRIGRAEHPRFAWTNPSSTASDPSIPNMQMSAAALLDLFCTANQFDEGGKINLNTAPAPVLRALAGGIDLRSDPQLKDTLNPLIPKTTHPIPPAMAEAFAQGVMRFRAKYPFYSPSQLAFIGTATNWPNTNNWPSNAVFGNTNAIALSVAPGNSLSSASANVREWNDQAAEEWFAKIFQLSTVYSRNFRVYVIAQKATNQAGTLIGVGPVVRKYYNVLIRQNGEGAGDAPGASPVTTFQSYY
jgi:hypothetical protein